ncbi:MAG: four helix bundle protein [Ignavibacteriaceae bacterium]|nr:four helix bundle protein [Ignavibacteriaceae bacterium]
MKTFEDLNVWKESKSLSLKIYSIKSISYRKDFGFKDQLQRASVSVMSNIAEGFERNGNKEFIKFLYYSKGSVGEVRSLFSLAVDLEYIQAEEYKEFKEICISLSQQIANFIKYLDKTKK